MSNELMTREMPELISRFWSKVRALESNACWMWTGYLNKSLYGNFKINHKTHKAHRVAWELANNKKAPDGLDVIHSCDNPPCCNPAHLSPATTQENMLDASRKGRLEGRSCPKGEMQWKARLTEDDVREIRKSTLSFGKEAKKWGVSIGCIQGIKHGYNWKHVK